ncbi:MAG: stringent starvation protein A [Xanthomonadales bacterium]|nr:glutathione S-transferase N-terminal domain-containing protein [Gammaproteobacteria bacterium]MBT8050968.1 glutathione S-transferase N-terminal domain-containing protein [Gammaproteobacteria bacterium]MBT8056673.1 glutathione S-transferase N-terminal domain-containing protein [Gammaproteobacteria bacterium]NNL03762.1 stringent starvation protein A [Xanthomonadales bacterium]
MALYSSETSLDCHRVRFVLAEKGINVDIVNISADESAAADLAELNPYNEAPTLVDRDLVLYDAGVINDYLDERYPHPPLMPVDPVSRAQLRLTHHRIIKDWYSLAYVLESARGKARETKAKQLKEGIIAANELFQMSEFVLSDELSLVDCTLGPLLWRLPFYGLKLGKPGASVEAYAHRIFSRPSFKSSLTQAERDLVLPA